MHVVLPFILSMLYGYSAGLSWAVLSSLSFNNKSTYTRLCDHTRKDPQKNKSN